MPVYRLNFIMDKETVMDIYDALTIIRIHKDCGIPEDATFREAMSIVRKYKGDHGEEWINKMYQSREDKFNG